MFWNKGRSLGKGKSMEKEYSDRIQTGIIEFEAGDTMNIALVYQAFAFTEEMILKMAAKAIHGYMTGLNSMELIRLDERFRQYTSLEWFLDWKQISLKEIKEQIGNQEEFYSVVKLGTFHPNGYYREKCLMELDGRTDALALVILRLNDWVENVRSKAYEILQEAIPNAAIEDLLYALPFLQKVKKGERKNSQSYCEIEDLIQNHIKADIKQLKLFHLKNYDFTIRKYVYSLLIENRMISKEETDKLLLFEKNSNCKSIIIRAILNTYVCESFEIDRYLTDKSVMVRRRALDYKYEMEKNAFPGIENLLLDASKSVREMACYIVRKHRDTNLADFYVSNLTTCTSVAILGIGENGKAEHGALLKPYLDSKDEKIVKSTLKALGQLWGTKGEDIFWKYLMDRRITVSKTAYHVIKSNNLKYGSEKIYNCFIDCENQNTKRYLIYLLLNENSWDRLPYLLLLYNYTDPAVQDKIRKKAAQRSMYGKVSEAEGEKIGQLLSEEELRIPKSLIADIKLDLKYVSVKKI